MNVVIVAGGLGSRLAPLTNNVPKFLVNIGKQTGYVEQVRYWLKNLPLFDGGNLSANTLNLTVIVHSAYADMVSEYHKMYFPLVELTIKTTDAANGSAHAISTCCEHLTGESVFFQWCDTMPNQPFTGDMLRWISGKANIIFTNYDHPNRYGTKQLDELGPVEAVLQPDGRGGIFGLYHISNFKPLPYADGQDFVEVISQYGTSYEVRLDSIVDWGDMPKLERTRSTADSAREFNKVEFHGELVVKSSLNEQGDGLITKEMNWYKLLNEFNAPLRGIRIPNTYFGSDGKSFIMSRVKGVPVFELWPSLDSENRALVLQRLIDQMKKLHSLHSINVSKKVIIDDIKTEARNKLISRWHEIRGFVECFGAVSSVNGQELSGCGRDYPEYIINSLCDELIGCDGNSGVYGALNFYSIVHGDLQMSNTMIDPDTLEVSIIDPRGYFGKTLGYGLPDYDIAKLLYSLNGYDLFNYSKTFHIDVVKTPYNTTDIKFDIPQPALGGCEDIIARTFRREHHIWLAIIFLGLAQYIKNDPVKCIAAHYHGLSLAEKVLSRKI